MITDYGTATTGTLVSDLIREIERSLLVAPERSVRAIMSAIEDDPFTARRAGIGETLVNISCGLDWSRSSTDSVYDGMFFALSRLRAICRFLTGLDIMGYSNATLQ